jgi:acyl carrier protein
VTSPLTPGDEQAEITKLLHSLLDTEAHLAVPSAELGDDDDLFVHGMTSHASVSVMLAIEDSFAIEFPDTMLNKRTFQSVAALREAIIELGGSARP